MAFNGSLELRTVGSNLHARFVHGTKRGHLLIAMPLKVDLTIHMDVESNPGPTPPSLTEATHREHNVNPGYRASSFSTLTTTNYRCYNSRLTLPLVPFVLSAAFLNTSRDTYSQSCVRPTKYRGSRAGKLVQEKRMRYSYNIQTLVSLPSSRSRFAYSRKTSNCSNHSNLTIILCKPIQRRKTPVMRPVHFCLINARSVNIAR